MPTVLLAVDGSPEAEHAARVAGELFGPSANYLAVSVAPFGAPMPVMWGGVYPYAPVYPPYPLVPGELDDDEHDVTREAEGVATAAATNADVDAETVGVTGDPVTAILQAADEHDVDVIVVGVGDKSWWDRLFTSSVSTGVAKQSRRPVLLIHPD